MGFTSENYRDAQAQLLPKGLIFGRNLTRKIMLLFSGSGPTWQGAQDKLATLADEANPVTTLDLLEGWERVAGCVPDPGATIEERRAAVIAKLAAQAVTASGDLIQIAIDAGSQFVEYRRPELFAVSPAFIWHGFAGNRMYNTPWQFKQYMYHPDIQAGSIEAGIIETVFSGIVHAEGGPIIHRFYDLPAFEGFEDNSWLITDPTGYLYDPDGLLKNHWEIEYSGSGSIDHGKTDGSIGEQPGRENHNRLWIKAGDIAASESFIMTPIRLAAFFTESQRFTAWSECTSAATPIIRKYVLCRCTADRNNAYGAFVEYNFSTNTRDVVTFKRVAGTETELDRQTFAFVSAFNEPTGIRFNVKDDAAPNDNKIQTEANDGTGWTVIFSVTDTEAVLYSATDTPKTEVYQDGAGTIGAADSFFIDNIYFDLAVI